MENKQPVGVSTDVMPCYSPTAQWGRKQKLVSILKTEGADILEKQFPLLKNLVLVLGDRDTCNVLTLVSSKSGVCGHLSEAGPHARYEE